MKLQTKFFLGILGVFLPLAIVVAIASVLWINANTIREAQQRVELHIRAAWDIYEEKKMQIRSTLDILAQSPRIKAVLVQHSNTTNKDILKQELEEIRKKNAMDILTLIDDKGNVVLRSRPPFNKNDNLSDDLLVSEALRTKGSCEGDIIFTSDRLRLEGQGLLEKCMRFGGEPKGMLTGAVIPLIEDGHVLGCIQMGILLNGATEIVDKIREGIFENVYYHEKPLGTATIFMGDLRISTNVVDDHGGRAIGTRVSEEVREKVLENGLSWTGRAWVVNAWYLSQYDPILDPDGNVIGMLYIGELEERYLDMRIKTVQTVLGIIFAGMLSAIIISFLIIRSFLIPVDKLSEATKKISQGDFLSRVEVKTRDEIGKLAESYNRMADQLDKHEQEIREKQSELSSVNSELRATNRNYMEMLGFVSHELKNPLASAIMSLYTVKDGYLGEISEAQQKGLESVGKSLDYFHDMIKNYLDLSRLEKGELVVNKLTVSLNSDVIEPVLGGLEREIEQKKIQIENFISKETGVLADRDLLRIVYDNLLSNAIKYGYSGGKIQLEADEDDNFVILSVTNEGQGIPRDKIDKLFKKFSRIDGPGYAGKKGTGLGLYICKEIIEKQGGEIRAESNEENWARFVFSLPKQRENFHE